MNVHFESIAPDKTGRRGVGDVAPISFLTGNTENTVQWPHNDQKSLDVRPREAKPHLAWSSDARASLDIGHAVANQREAVADTPNIGSR